jgi:hypothetical protein
VRSHGVLEDVQRYRRIVIGVVGVRKVDGVRDRFDSSGVIQNLGKVVTILQCARSGSFLTSASRENIYVVVAT